jgi:ABC-type lipoprotein export system ATPase subunit
MVYFGVINRFTKSEDIWRQYKVNNIELLNIEKSFTGNGMTTNILQSIHLSFNKKDFTTIVGASGSGKSTLLSLIGTLDLPTSGSIIFEGVDIATLKGNKLADFRFENIGFIFQSFNLIPTLTALENVTVPLFPRKVPFNKITRATELLEQVGLIDKLKSLPSQLSGGEQQRVAIARALINKPRWLLADEPTGNLDSKNGENICELIQTIKRENNCGVLFVTHDMQLASRGDRMIVMKDGAVIQDSFDGEKL